MQIKPQNIDQYIATFSAEIQEILQKLRQTIASNAPDAEETINYGIPTFTLHGNLVHFAAMKKHIGFYPTPSGIQAFQAQLKPYESSKGAVQFPIDQEIPYDLISEITKYRVSENLEKYNSKKQKRKCPNGHIYYKSSDCPTCPKCESESKPQNGFLSLLAAPARRAIQHAGIKSLTQLSQWSESDLLKLHGLGPGSIPLLKKILKENSLQFMDEKKV